MFKKFNVDLPHINNTEYKITDYGAVSGGVVSNTKAFKETILAAAVAAAVRESPVRLPRSKAKKAI